MSGTLARKLLVRIATLYVKRDTYQKGGQVEAVSKIDVKIKLLEDLLTILIENGINATDTAAVIEETLSLTE